MARELVGGGGKLAQDGWVKFPKAGGLRIEVRKGMSLVVIG